MDGSPPLWYEPRTLIAPGDTAAGYRIAFCHRDGQRWLELVQNGESAANALWYSTTIPAEKAAGKNVYTVADFQEPMNLEDGRQVFLDAHGIWLTPEEVDAMRAGTDFDKIPWATGCMPRFAPK